MKKVISLILVLAMCLPLCACSGKNGTNSKYVGTYTGTNVAPSYKSSPLNVKLTLNADGTGKEECWFKETEQLGKKGELFLTQDVQWVENDGYITITYTKTFCAYPEEYKYSDEYSLTYEMKGIQLLDVGGNNLWPLTKVD